jgi:hypothetical protein
VASGTDAFFPIQVGQSSASEKALVLIHGLPVTSVLSAGRLFESGTWALRMSDLQGLRIEITPTAKGDAALSLSLVTIDGRVLAEHHMTLLVQPQNAPFRSAPEVTGSHALAVAPTATEDTEERLEEPPVLMARGDANVGEGKIHVARLFYRRAAESGWAEGAVAMARTYDPSELAKMKVVGGVRGSPELARQWYEKARALGAKVDDQLRRLGGG